MPELMTPEKKMDNVRAMLTKMVPQLALAVGETVTAQRLARIATTSVLRTPKLLECDPKTLAGAVMECAQMGLEPDGREGHLVPFWNNKRKCFEVTLIPDYKGLARLARNSGQIKTLDWREVREGDKFEYRYGSTATLIHVPSDKPIHWKEDSGEKNERGEPIMRWKERPITHAYSLAILDGGEPVFEVMTVTDIEWHRDRYSRAAGDGPWVTNFDSMAAKTCFRKLSKKLPRRSTDALDRAVELDEKAEQGISQDLGGLVLPTDDGAAGTTGSPEAPAAGETKLDKLTGELKSQKANGKPAAPPAPEASPAEMATGPSEKAGGLTAPAAASEPKGGGAPSTAKNAEAPGISPPTATNAAASDAPPATAAKARSAATAPAQEKADRTTTAVAGPGGVEEPNEIAAADAIRRIDGLFIELGLNAPAKKPQAEFLWNRLVGAGVTRAQATHEKLTVLEKELRRLVEIKKKK